jgi:hypothetical protein
MRIAVALLPSRRGDPRWHRAGCPGLDLKRRNRDTPHRMMGGRKYGKEIARYFSPSGKRLPPSSSGGASEPHVTPQLVSREQGKITTDAVISIHRLQ